MKGQLPDKEGQGNEGGAAAEQEPMGQGTTFVYCNDVKGNVKDTINQAFQLSGSKVRLKKKFLCLCACESRHSTLSYSFRPLKKHTKFLFFEVRSS